MLGRIFSRGAAQGSKINIPKFARVWIEAFDIPCEPKNAIRVLEVGLRDGLQVEKEFISTEKKLELTRRLANCWKGYSGNAFTQWRQGTSKWNHPAIELTSFVSPKAIPQFADSVEFTKQVMDSKFSNKPDYSFLALNPTGVVQACEMGAKQVNLFIAVSDRFNYVNAKSQEDKNKEERLAKKNDNRTALHEYQKKAAPEKTQLLKSNVRKMAKDAKAKGVKRVRVYVSTAWHCALKEKTDLRKEGMDPEKAGLIDLDETAALVNELLAIPGVDEVAISDTTGRATPERVTELLEKIPEGDRKNKIALHFHDTYEHINAIDNVDAGLAMGVVTYDSSIGGLGGCPYMPGASGNLDTVKLVKHLHKKGVETGLDIGELKKTVEYIRSSEGLNIAKKDPKPNPHVVQRADTGASKAGDASFRLTRHVKSLAEMAGWKKPDDGARAGK